MNQFNFNCFKALDIRGKIEKELSDQLVYHIGKALAIFLKPKTIVLGSDVRLTSPKFKSLLAEGLMEMGVDVIDIGTVGTEQIYFATNYLNADGGVEVTASHNPKDYNGLKIVGKNAVPFSSDYGLDEIRKIIEDNIYPEVQVKGTITYLDISEPYIDKLLSFINLKNLQGDKKLRVLVNCGNGVAGQVVKKIQQKLLISGANLEFVDMFFEPDGNFPNGIPNPLLVENREVTSKAIVESKADLGIAFDGDFDRCFFFDSKGEFIEGYYLCCLLSQAFALKNKGAKIIYEPRLYWNTVNTIQSNGAIPILCKSGHSFIKAKLREVDAVYGGEISAHHYFRDYYFCDSGMIPWLLIVELIKTTNKSIKDLVEDMRLKFPCSDEINFKVVNTQVCIEAVRSKYAAEAKEILTVDGLGFDMGEWRFNLRKSNTEPLLRLNVESRNNRKLVDDKVAEISEIIKLA